MDSMRERAGPGDPPSTLAPPQPVVPTDAYAVRICGIGGTGVVTVAQIVGTAATLDGYHVRGLDQIGLSQKAGPVVSDVRLSRSAPMATNRLGAGQADLLLAFDQLVAASDKGLLTASPTATTVVGSVAPVPTGAMIAHPEISLPDPDDLVDRIASVTRPDAQHWADAQAITTELFGSATTANVFVVGMAVQAGCLPVDPARIEEAIALNGVAVEANTAAFRWGRTQIADPAAVVAARSHGKDSGGAGTDVAAPALPGPITARIDALGRPELVSQLALFAVELIAWGDEPVASGWLDVVERVSAAEHELATAGVTAAARGELTATVAANLFTLTAYKDEYEVARLMTDPDGTAVVASVAQPGDRVAWKLHPPMLKALGMGGKISVGAWAEPGVRLLARGKRLRGTPADPFGRTELRRLEQELPGEYAAAIDKALGTLTADNLDQAVALAALADQVRGYEDLKLRRIAEYRTALATALAALGL